LSKPGFTTRLVSILGAFTCIIAGILLFLSIGASLFRWTFINPGPGNLLADAYGMFAFIIPLYLFWAAWILIDPAFRPGRIFLLSSTVIPFLTMALGFSCIRDFEIHRGEFEVLDVLGRSGLSIAVITATILECLGLLIVHSFFFGNHENPVSPQSHPLPAEPVRSEPAVAKKETVDESVHRTAVEKPAVLPEWKPLASSAAFRELEEEKNRELEKPAPPSGQISKTREIPVQAKAVVKDTVVVLDPSVFTPYTQVSEVPQFVVKEALDELEQLEPHFDDTEYTADVSGNEVQEDDPGDSFYEPEPFDKLEPLDKIEDFPPVEPKAVNVPNTVKKNRKTHKGTYVVPIDGILNQYPDGQYWIVDEETNRAARTLQDTLGEFGIQAEVTGIRKGPVITMFEILPAPGVKLSKIVNLQDNIALRLAASSVRIVAPIPGKHAVGIEVPNKKRNIVSFREIIEGELNHKREHRKSEVPVVLGKGITGEAVTVDLTQMPHLLIAGATGSGKSVCVNAMILSILYQLSPAECRLILIDPKIVELKLYNDTPHLLTPVITEPKRAFQALQYCIYEMERRYACLDSMGVRDMKSYNKRIKERNIAAEHMPYIVVVIDEFADLMATTGKELESTVARLAAMSRAVGIHLVLATQRPSIDVITGLIKANIPSRIAFMVASKMDSRIIIDMVGAEKLLGKGDMLYAGAVDPFPIRMQGAFISEEEVEHVVEYVKTLGEPEYIDDEIFYDEEEEDAGASLFSEGDDPLYEKAIEIVFQQGKASASYIQRRLKIGYNRAARLVEEMEHRGVVGPAQGSKPRELLRIA
jgi:S-DNA-T family DNA segregation ATPase FtsK/SpoIIIE